MSKRKSEYVNPQAFDGDRAIAQKRASKVENKLQQESKKKGFVYLKTSDDTKQEDATEEESKHKPSDHPLYTDWGAYGVKSKKRRLSKKRKSNKKKTIRRKRR
jgi:hypothetical protein